MMSDRKLHPSSSPFKMPEPELTLLSFTCFSSRGSSERVSSRRAQARDGLSWEGWLYLAVVLDLFSRRVVGWAMQSHLKTERALEALYMALGRRVPEAGLVHHSDRGVQYAAESYQDVLDSRGIICSMSRRGDCWDNAVTESFFGTLKTELVYRRPWPTQRDAKNAIADYIEAFLQPVPTPLNAQLPQPDGVRTVSRS